MAGEIFETEFEKIERIIHENDDLVEGEISKNNWKRTEDNLFFVKLTRVNGTHERSILQNTVDHFGRGITTRTTLFVSLPCCYFNQSLRYLFFSFPLDDFPRWIFTECNRAPMSVPKYPKAKEPTHQ